jgi:uncharacterized protein YeaO (DUF488 family)
MVKIIRTGEIYAEQIPNSFEKWAIVRSPVKLNNSYILVQALAPSCDLFKKYREAIHSGNFNESFFEEKYVPQFLREINSDTETLLLEMVHMSREKDIILCCYCKDIRLCHRSIVAGILLGLGADIQTQAEFIRYFKMYQALRQY